MGQKNRGKWENFFLPCTAWTETAKIIHADYKEGDDVLLTSARLTCDSWKDKVTGEAKRQLKVVVFGIERFEKNAPAVPKPPPEDKGIPPELVQDTAEETEGGPF